MNRDRKVIISTESACELPLDILKDNDIRTIQVRHYLDGEEMTYSGLSMDELYEEMEKGKRLTTSQVNEFEYMEHFETLLKEGKDVVHIGFTSGLSGMFNNCKLSLEKLDPSLKNKVYIIDTKHGSLALGILTLIACELADDGNTADEIIQKIDELKDHVSTICTANELKYLYASGRLSKLTAIVGGILNIKPIFKVAENGKFQTISKTMNRKKSLLDLVNYVKEKYENIGDQHVYVLHAKCIDDAKFVQQEISKIVPVKVDILDFGPIIGGHSGPGTMAVFFTSKSR